MVQGVSGEDTIDLKGLARFGLDPFAVDVAHILLEERGIFELDSSDINTGEL